MKVVTGDELGEILDKREPLTIIYLHTPLCGTCKLAGKMTEVVGSSLDIPIYSLNVNQSPEFAITWKVESVPCLLVFQKGFGVERIYAFRSISYIYNILKRYTGCQNLQQSVELKGEQE
ncbi:thioredoxin family protein [bacterium LRH843]|nr:thioredoxin family protein [bacterium LRH843]